MATATRTIKIVNKTKSTISIKDFFSTALMKFSESLGDTIITVAVTAAALIWMTISVHPYLVDLVSGYYIFGMLIQLMIRIVHRFDDSYTVNELAHQVLRIEEENNTRWENYFNNFVP